MPDLGFDKGSQRPVEAGEIAGRVTPSAAELTSLPVGIGKIRDLGKTVAGLAACAVGAVTFCAMFLEKLSDGGCFCRFWQAGLS